MNNEAEKLANARRHLEAISRVRAAFDALRTAFVLPKQLVFQPRIKPADPIKVIIMDMSSKFKLTGRC